MTCHSGNAIYVVAVQRNFVARHFLFGGDWGPENEIHSHHYRVEAQLEGSELDQHGYLVDIVEIESVLDSLVDRYRDNVLNQLKEFSGINPSIEHFSRIFCENMWSGVTASNISGITIRIWENEIAWASYRRERS
ncbi:MAG: 6-carboxytetrahydropterin synthase [Desulfomonilaceae bacterium]|jgi:6-pyruvoyltetrahydropterin/6-carboxytetrahydropterin synthase